MGSGAGFVILAELWSCCPVAARSAAGAEALGVLGAISVAVAIGAAEAVQAAVYLFSGGGLTAPPSAGPIPDKPLSSAVSAQT